MVLKLNSDIHKVKGFLDPMEGEILNEFASKYVKDRPAIEIGSYCGKSAIYLGEAIKKNKQKLYSIDHHKGSEEQQLGEEYFDPDLISSDGKSIDTLPYFLKTIRDFDLVGVVIPIVSSSKEASEDLDCNFDMVFIDGGHSEEAANEDYKIWSQKLRINGILAIHDVFPNPKDGGRPPFNIYSKALDSKKFKELEAVKSLRILQKID